MKSCANTKFVKWCDGWILFLLENTSAFFRFVFLRVKEGWVEKMHASESLVFSCVLLWVSVRMQRKRRFVGVREERHFRRLGMAVMCFLLFVLFCCFVFVFFVVVFTIHDELVIVERVERECVCAVTGRLVSASTLDLRMSSILL